VKHEYLKDKWNGPGTICSPATTLEISAVVLDRLNVIIDRLNVIIDRLNVIIDRLNAISSGIVLFMKMQKYVSKGTIWRQYLKSDQGEIW
jgi:hypothetical protein